MKCPAQCWKKQRMLENHDLLLTMPCSAAASRQRKHTRVSAGGTGALEKHCLVELVTIVDGRAVRSSQGKRNPNSSPSIGEYDAEALLVTAAVRQIWGLHRSQRSDMMVYLQTWSIVAVALFEHAVRFEHVAPVSKFEGSKFTRGVCASVKSPSRLAGVGTCHACHALRQGPAESGPAK